MRPLYPLIILALAVPVSSFAGANSDSGKETAVRKENVAYVALRDIKNGDTKSEVLAKAGEPGSISPKTATKGETWEYWEDHLTVWIEFDGNKVKSIAHREI